MACTIRAISFDGDGTLWDFEAAMRGALADVIAALRQRDAAVAAGLTVERLMALRDEVAEEWRERGARLEEIRRESFRRLVTELGQPDGALADDLCRLYMAQRFARIALYPDVLPALQTLRRRYRIGLLSNGNTYPERCGLEGLFDFVVFAQEHGFLKPDPRAFAIALQRAGCARSELLHVGDSLVNDVMGAQNAGIRAIWLNRAGLPNDEGIEVACEMRTLVELPAWLAHEGGNKEDPYGG